MVKPISSWKYEDWNQTSPWGQQSDWNKRGMPDFAKICQSWCGPFPILWSCLVWVVEQWHLGPTAWMPRTPQQGPYPTAVSCLQGRRQEMAHGDRPLPENICWHRHISLHSHAMLLVFSSSMTSHPACRSLSRLASVPGTWAVANTHDISAAAGETQDRQRGNPMFSMWNLTGWQQPWNLYHQFFLMWFAGLHAVDPTSTVPSLSLWHNRAPTGATTLHVQTRVFCAYMLLKESSHLTGMALGNF